MAFDLKSEKDVKEYVDNLGIEYRFGCYSEKKPASKLPTYTIIHLTRPFESLICNVLCV